MKRLTDIDPYWMGEETWLSAREPDEDAVDKVYEKLWKYENTGLDPEEIACRVPRWISAKEPPVKWRKDDRDKELINYLIYSPDYGVDIGNWLAPAKMWLIMGLPAKVTHWMPLPSAPKE